MINRGTLDIVILLLCRRCLLRHVSP